MTSLGCEVISLNLSGHCPSCLHVRSVTLLVNPIESCFGITMLSSSGYTSIAAPILPCRNCPKSILASGNFCCTDVWNWVQLPFKGSEKVGTRSLACCVKGMPHWK